MKKKIVSAVFIAAIAIAAGYTMQQNAEKNDMSDLELANVEALARGENPDGTITGSNWVKEREPYIQIGPGGSPIHGVNCFGTGEIWCVLGV